MNYDSQVDGLRLSINQIEIRSRLFWINIKNHDSCREMLLFFLESIIIMLRLWLEDFWLRLKVSLLQILVRCSLIVDEKEGSEMSCVLPLLLER